MIILTLVVLIASQGEVIDDLKLYPHDSIFLLMYFVLGCFLVRKLIDINDNNILTTFASFIYFYSAFASFTDGHAAGWGHSTQFFEKIFMTGTYMLVSSVTVYIPLVLFCVAFFHNLAILKFFGVKGKTRAPIETNDHIS